ncbi:hypothetical protein CFOL_v3_12454, partial [Cephalotus follicularis]
LEKENKNLKEEIDALKKTFSKLSNSSEKLENLLGMQRCVFDKAGLGYEEINNVKLYQNFFKRKENIEKEKVRKVDNKKKIVKVLCDYCGKIGHTYLPCFHKRNAMIKKNVNSSCNFCGKYGHVSSSCYHKRNAMYKRNAITSCSHCGKYGHTSSSCFYKRNTLHKGKMIVSCNNCGKNGHIFTSCLYKENILNDSNFKNKEKL